MTRGLPPFGVHDPPTIGTPTTDITTSSSPSCSTPTKAPMGKGAVALSLAGGPPTSETNPMHCNE